MTPDRMTRLAALLWLAFPSLALAQTTNPAPPIPTTGPAGSNSTANTLAATDFNWVWVSLVIIVLGAALWYVVRKRQSR
ncbi:hypothetical protein [Methylobacterium gossipiicola]|uniref:LPXTG-motif cell wall anchor domain-containing protein n=1 Tax=Methylobacterium gossipiicola TaxID=582675 RepID=A0A1I2V6X4_9HYPH|nr:hypothetical protein [Methylobacterium gossipiicola]SFG85104.1 hypothetical protein SAMN05192565_113104 [Methylobacterium gossipiicola]